MGIKAKYCVFKGHMINVQRDVLSSSQTEKDMI